ncbi:MAG: protease complex subunit PrcB family protein [Candidatus Hodarchaeales archaeon]
MISIVTLTLFLLIVPKPIYFLTISKGLDARYDHKFLVIHNKEDLDNLTSELELVIPKVDFYSYFVVAVFQGEKGSSGYDIKITNIEFSTTTFRVYVREQEPCSDCMVLDVMTYPYHIIVVPRIIGYFHFNVDFIVNRIVYSY